jgi:YVTN family beta-propeller protein
LSTIAIPADKTVSTVQIGTSSVGTATVQASTPQEVVVSPDGTRAYVSDGVSSVWVVDTATNSVVTQVPAGQEPGELEISPDGKSVYAAILTCAASSCVASISVIDTASNTVTSTIPVATGLGVELTGIAVTPDGQRLFVAASPGGNVYVIATATNEVTATIATTNTGNSGLAISPDGRRVFAAGWVKGLYVNTSFADVIDTQTQDQSAAIELGNGETPTRIAITPDGTQGFVLGDAGHISVFDAVQDALKGTLTVSAGNPLSGIAFTPDGTRMYVSCGNTSTLYVLDTSGSAIVGTIPSGSPGGVAIHSAG